MRLTCLLLLLAGCARLSAQVTVADSIFLRQHYTKREVMIPMHDGVRLFTSIYTPKNAVQAYPMLIKRTPYSCAPYGENAFPTAFQNRYLAQSGYIWVFQDVRGKYRSEGDFVDVRPFQPDKNRPGPVTKKGKQTRNVRAGKVETAIDEASEQQNPAGHSNRIVMGPWVHGGWARTAGDRLGNVVFGQPTSDYYQKEVEMRFFEPYLKDNGPLDLPEALVFETGSNRWTRYDAWPPRDAQPTTYYFLERTREYLTDDQRFAARRPDVLLYQMLVRGEIMRGRYRNSFEQPEAFPENVMSNVRFTLPDVAHTFLPGHRLMVQVQSSWFPLDDRNPQKFTNIYTAGDSDFEKATITILHFNLAPSGIILPVRKD